MQRPRGKVRFVQIGHLCCTPENLRLFSERRAIIKNRFSNAAKNFNKIIGAVWIASKIGDHARQKVIVEFNWWKKTSTKFARLGWASIENSKTADPFTGSRRNLSWRIYFFVTKFVLDSFKTARVRRYFKKDAIKVYENVAANQAQITAFWIYEGM